MGACVRREYFSLQPEKQETPSFRAGSSHTGTYKTDGSDCVGFDNRSAAAIAAKYLVDIGHRNFTIIAGITKDNERASERIIGIREKLKKLVLELREDRVLERKYETDEGGAAFRHLMSLDYPPSAIVCGNDILGFGAILEPIKMGLIFLKIFR